jgi:general secretion pathway protein G
MPNRHSLQRPPQRPLRRSGFTLLELLLVMAILVMIIGIVSVNIGGVQTESNVNTTKIQIGPIKQAIEMYRVRMNALPDTLEALRDGPSNSEQKARWTEAIMKEIPVDAWGNAFIYEKTGNDYKIRSAGADLQANTEDDIVVE